MQYGLVKAVFAGHELRVLQRRQTRQEDKLRTERDRFVTDVFMGKDLEYQFIFHRT